MGGVGGVCEFVRSGWRFVCSKMGGWAEGAAVEVGNGRDSALCAQRNTGVSGRHTSTKRICVEKWFYLFYINCVVRRDRLNIWVHNRPYKSPYPLCVAQHDIAEMDV